MSRLISDALAAPALSRSPSVGGGSSWGPLASGGCRAVRGGASGGSGTPGTLCTLRSPSQSEAAPATRGAVNDSDRKRSVHRPQPHVPGAWDRAGCRPVAAAHRCALPAASARPCRTPSAVTAKALDAAHALTVYR